MPKDQIDIELDALEASFGADGYEDVPQGGSGEMLVVSET